MVYVTSVVCYLGLNYYLNSSNILQIMFFKYCLKETLF